MSPSRLGQIITKIPGTRYEVLLPGNNEIQLLLGDHIEARKRLEDESVEPVANAIVKLLSMVKIYLNEAEISTIARSLVSRAEDYDKAGKRPQKQDYSQFSEENYGERTFRHPHDPSQIIEGSSPQPSDLSYIAATLHRLENQIGFIMKELPRLENLEYGVAELLRALENNLLIGRSVLPVTTDVKTRESGTWTINGKQPELGTSEYSKPSSHHVEEPILATDTAGRHEGSAPHATVRTAETTLETPKPLAPTPEKTPKKPSATAKVSPVTESALIAHLRDAWNQSDIETSRELAIELIRLQPSKKESWEILAKVLKNLKDMDFAENMRIQSYALNPATAAFPIALGEVFLHHGNIEKARDVLEACSTDFATDEKIWATLYTVYQRLGLNDKAQEALSKAMGPLPAKNEEKTKPSASESALIAHLRDAWVQKDFDAARRIGTDLIKAPPTKADSWDLLAKVIKGLRDRQYSEKMHILSVNLKPNSASFPVALAEDFLRYNDMNTAKIILEGAAKKFPKSDRVWAALYTIYQRLGMNDKAQEALSKAMGSSVTPG